MTIITLPAGTALTVEVLMAVLETDWRRAQVHHAIVKADPLMPPEIVENYADQVRRLKVTLDTIRAGTVRHIVTHRSCLKVTLDTIRVYREAAEEAVVVDADEPLPITITEAGYRAVEAA